MPFTLDCTKASVEFLKVSIAKRDEHSLERQQQIAAARLQRAYQAQIRTARRRTSIAEIERLLRAGNETEAINRSLLNSGEIAGQSANAFIAAGESAARQIAGKQRTRFSFSRRGASAAAVIADIESSTAAHFDNQQRAASRILLDDARARGLGVREQARAIYNAIGLDRQRAVNVVNYRNQLVSLDNAALGRELRDRRFDSTISRAIRSQQKLRANKINSAVSRLQRRQINSRATVIGATESTRAIEAGAAEARNQAIEQGVITMDKIELVWMTSQDERVRGSHSAMHLQKRPEGQTFLSGAGNALRYPGDRNAPASDWVNCRCWLDTKFL